MLWFRKPKAIRKIFSFSEGVKVLRRHTIKIHWSYPVLLNNIFNKDEVYGTGLYYISRKRENSEKLIYIGKTIDCFYNRLAAHSNTWLSDLRGPFYVRIGTIISPQYYDNNLLEDIESAIIMSTNPPNNRDKRWSYTYRSGYLVRIHNEGYYGDLPKIIDAELQLDPSSL